LDPVLNPILNKEIHRTGGRLLIRLGSEEIDFSPSFTMFLCTRDSNCRLSPDLLSRVTLVNFSITPASLQSQALSKILESERPDIDKKRTDVMKLQGEYAAKLRELEKSLLAELNKVEGDILSNDVVLKALEDIKAEAAQITVKQEQSEKVMADVEAVTLQWLPLATASTEVWFVLEALSRMNPFYQFSLNYFMGILDDVLGRDKSNQPPGSHGYEHIHKLRDGFFCEIMRRVQRSLMHKDKLLLGVRLAQIRTDGTANEPNEDGLNFLVQGQVDGSALGDLMDDTGGSRGGGVQTQLFVKLVSLISSDECRATFEAIPQKQKEEFNTILSLRSLSGLEEHIVANAAEWSSLLLSGAESDVIPSGWENEDQITSPNAIFKRIILMKAMRPDKMLSLIEEWVISVFGKSFPLQEELDLTENVKSYGRSTAPLLLCSQPGHDASGKVDALAKSFNVKSYKSVSMGSLEGFDMANSVISTGARDGSWVLLRNVHLCPEWLVTLEKKLHALLPKAHTDFRLFMTAEISLKIPANIIKASEVFVFEPPSGVKAALHRSLAQISPQRMNKAPAERAKLHFLLAWMHSIIQERLRYAPSGWTQRYEFSDLDQKCALDVADFWLDKSAAGRQNLAPESIPWDAIQTLLHESIYGGRIGTEFDQLLLKSLLDTYLTAKSYDAGFMLVEGETTEESIFVPSLTSDNKEEQLRAFLDALPDSNPPTWLGLPAAAHTVLLSNQATSLLHSWSQVQLDDSGDLAKGDDTVVEKEGQSRSHNMISSVRRWLSMLPSALPLAYGAKSQINPILRFLQRELSSASVLLGLVRENLGTVASVLSLEGTTQATNEARSLIKCLLGGKVPIAWTQHYVSVEMGVNSWINDFARRLEQLARLCELNEGTAKTDASTGSSSISLCMLQGKDNAVWLGGFLSPGAFITATRQVVAQSKGVSLAELRLVMGSDPNGSSFTVKNLVLEGAQWKDPALSIAMVSSARTNLSPVSFSWIKSDGTGTAAAPTISIPVYLNCKRLSLLFSIAAQLPEENEGGNLKRLQMSDVLVQRGVGLVLWD